MMFMTLAGLTDFSFFIQIFIIPSTILQCVGYFIRFLLLYKHIQISFFIFYLITMIVIIFIYGKEGGMHIVE